MNHNAACLISSVDLICDKDSCFPIPKASLKNAESVKETSFQNNLVRIITKDRQGIIVDE